MAEAEHDGAPSASIPDGAPDDRPQERAAGGVVIRQGEGGRRELAVVHRPRYDDWSLPKGKLNRGEGWLEAALREVREETGMRCAPGEELAPSRYLDRKGRRKLVRWWLMRPLEGSFEPGGEVDEMRWVALEEAGVSLSYEHDRELVRSAGVVGR